MIFYPAIDLKDGRCVRLLRGDMKTATVYQKTPEEQARLFVEAGCSWIHVVDLNGAFEGKPVNIQAVKNILMVMGEAKVQLGGGIRDLRTIEEWLHCGISRVILGTAALKAPDLVIEACKAFPNQIAVSIDSKGGVVAINGWGELSDIRAEELAVQFEGVGVAAIITTDIDRDGAMHGPNFAQVGKMVEALTIPVILSGGIKSIEDLRSAALITPPIGGIISGRAIYEGALTVSEALKSLRST